MAAERGHIDAVIEPSTTRLELRKALAQLRDKRIGDVPHRHYLMPVWFRRFLKVGSLSVN